MTQQPPPATNVFDAAKAIAETLKQLDREQQEQAIRYASDSLGLGVAKHPQQPVGPSAPTGTAMPSQSTSLPAHSPDIRTFSDAKKPKTHMQFAAVVAYFYRYEAPEEQRKESIKAEDLREAVRLVGWKGLTKPYPTLNNAKAAGYLDAAGGGQFRLSTVGENLVAVTLPGDGTESGGPTYGGKRKTRNKMAKGKTPSSKRSKRGR